MAAGLSIVSPVWRAVPTDAGKQIECCLDASLDKTSGPVHVFFRADDVAAPSIRFSSLVDTFMANRTPLNLAVVPAWMNDSRWAVIRRLGKAAPDLLSWHQHGWRHANHQPSGKKQEFGPVRAGNDIQKDLLKGKNRLERIMGDSFFPAFTPPWNRCDHRTLALLSALNYRAVSRDQAVSPKAPPGLAEFSVHVDLHTMREKDPAAGWRRLLLDMGASIVSGNCGIMIHHQRMNDAAFHVLAILLKTIARKKRLQPVSFEDLVGQDTSTDRRTGGPRNL